MKQDWRDGKRRMTDERNRQRWCGDCEWLKSAEAPRALRDCRQPFLSALRIALTALIAAILGVSPALADNSTQALVAQARALEHGEGVPRDTARAAELYCQAARMGEAEAQFSLGWMYANGRGLERDDAFAASLFELAAARGHDHATRMLRFTGSGTGRLPECFRGNGAVLAAGMPDLSARVARLPEDRRRIAELVVVHAEEFGISPSLALAIALTESALDPAAVSPKNAMGVMQLIQATADRFRVSDAFDPEQNIRGGLAYLRWLLAYFEGDIALAAAAYNAGEGAVERYRGVPPFRETRAYVERILALVQHTEHPFDSAVAAPSAVIRAARLQGES